jgi:transposase
MNNGKVTFKTYSMAQLRLIPPSWDEMIPPEHLVRVVNRVLEQIDIKSLLENYKGGVTSSYHPRMMLKVIVYALRRRSIHAVGSQKRCGKT